MTGSSVGSQKMPILLGAMEKHDVRMVAALNATVEIHKLSLREDDSNNVKLAFMRSLICCLRCSLIRTGLVLTVDSCLFSVCLRDRLRKRLSGAVAALGDQYRLYICAPLAALTFTFGVFHLSRPMKVSPGSTLQLWNIFFMYSCGWLSSSM